MPGTAAGRRLCRLADIPEGTGKGFVLGEGAKRQAIFVVHRAGCVRGYVNSCPHVGTPLDWAPDRFLSPDRSLIQCSTHGARFRIEDGYCVSGPCAGDSLEPVEVAVADGWVVVRRAPGARRGRP